MTDKIDLPVKYWLQVELKSDDPKIIRDAVVILARYGRSGSFLVTDNFRTMRMSHGAAKIIKDLLVLEKKCPGCGAMCDWVDDQWHCPECGDEYPIPCLTS